VQTGTDSTDGTAQGYGRISVIYFLEVAKDHHLAISSGQRVNGATQGVQTFAAGQIEQRVVHHRQFGVDEIVAIGF
jgi:hypothetical protein